METTVPQKGTKHGQGIRPSEARDALDGQRQDDRSRVRRAGLGLHPGARERSGRAAGLAPATGALDAALAGLVARVGQDVADAVIQALAPALERGGPRLLDRRGIAEALHVGVDTVDRLRREGCPELTVGDAPRFEIGAVIEWLRGRP